MAEWMVAHGDGCRETRAARARGDRKAAVYARMENISRRPMQSRGGLDGTGMQTIPDTDDP
jgi:hypothetical protein